jgi:ATP-dependent Clp protease ATP-binding subunit ClpC
MALIKLTSRYLPDRHLPDKAIDAMDEVGSRIHISKISVPKEILDIEQKIVETNIQKNEVVKKQKYEDAAKLRDKEKTLERELEEAKERWEEEQLKNRQLVTEHDVAEVVSQMSGIPLTKVTVSENKRLKNMFNELSGKVIGQDEALSKIVKAIQRAKMGMKDPNRPLLTSLMVGDSGVGKTHMAKELAKHLFNSEDALIRLDMSEYMEKTDVNKILGSAAGYVGYEQGSNFLNSVRTKPYSVILLDEIEKAHPDIFNVFLQMLDDGHLTDAQGRKASFKNCVILMSSNVGVKVLKDFGTGVGFSTKSSESSNGEKIKSILDGELKKKFAPEFINRLDEIIYFNSLSKENINSILDLELNKSQKRLNEIGFSFEIDQSMRDHLCEVGYDPKYGARPLKRSIQKWVDDYITETLLDEPEKDSILKLSYDKEENKTKIELVLKQV